MIETKTKGIERSTKLEGNVPDLMTDYSMITMSLVNAFVKEGMPREEAIDLVREAHNVALLSDEERYEKAKKSLKSLVGKLSNVFDALFDEEDAEDEVEEDE